jgi:WhiB family transcriptional regulator, redox-sensing transcriptional regulator
MQPLTSVDLTGDWENLARCRGSDGELFFTPGAAQEFRAKAICRSCPVRWECLAYALRNRVEHGVWGGLTDRERRRVLNRARPSYWDPETAMRVVS